METVKIEFIERVLEQLRFYPCFSQDVKEFIACQFALESNYGKSRLAVECQNYCGMRFPFVRITCAIGKDPRSGFACYESFYTCVMDYILALEYHQPLRKELENLNLFKGFIKWYCPEKDYINKIINLLNSYQNVKTK